MTERGLETNMQEGRRIDPAPIRAMLRSTSGSRTTQGAAAEETPLG